jgi:chitinase
MQHLAVVKDFLIGEKEVVKKEILTEEEFNSIFKNPLASGKSGACPGYDFYNYNDFINAVHEYPKFGNEGTEEIRKREIAAFLANISHETTGGWSTAPGGRYLWGLCWIEEIACTDTICTQYCQEGNVEYPCASGKTYHGRGPIQLTWNYNYGAVGDKIGIDLLSNPELVSTDASISFRTALWFWNTPQSPKPSSHDVMVENWIPTSDDLAKNRDIGFGMTVNIINGGAECGKIDDSRVNDRVEHFKFFCDLLNTTTGDNLYCDDMVHFK